jgi:hypothetical protein
LIVGASEEVGFIRSALSSFRVVFRLLCFLLLLCIRSSVVRLNTFNVFANKAFLSMIADFRIFRKSNTYVRDHGIQIQAAHPHPHQLSLGPTGIGLPGGWLTSPLPFPFVLIAGFGEGGKCAYEGVNPSYFPVLGLRPIPIALTPPDVDLGGGPKLADARIFSGAERNPSPIPAP